jgi:hypothetical protein
MKFALLIASIVDFVAVTLYFAGSGAFGITWLSFLLLIMYVIFVIAAWMSMGIPISSLPRQLLSYSILLGPPLCFVVLQTLGSIIPMCILTLLILTPIPILCVLALVRGQYKTGHIISPWTFTAICAMTIMQPTMPAFALLLFYRVSSSVIMLAVLLSAVSLGVMAAIKDRQRAIQIITANIASTGMVLVSILIAVDRLWT